MISPGRGADAQAFGEAFDQRLLDGLEVRHFIAKQFLQCNYALRRRIELALGQFAFRDIQRIDHLLRIHVDQHGALIDEHIAVKETSGATDFAAINFDVVTRPKLRVYTQLAQAQRCGIADFTCQVR